MTDSTTGSTLTAPTTDDAIENFETARLINIEGSDAKAPGETSETADDKEMIEFVIEERSPEDTKAIYNMWASAYDFDLQNKQYKAPQKLAEYIATTLNIPKKANVLDVGCGTGLLGKELLAMGYNQVDGVDMSEEMLRESRKKGCYKNYFLDTVAPGAKLPLRKVSYSCVALCCTLAPGHITFKALDVLASKLKTDGYLVSLGRRFSDLEARSTDFKADKVSEFVSRFTDKMEKTYEQDIPEIRKGTTGTLICFKRK